MQEILKFLSTTVVEFNLFKGGKKEKITFNNVCIERYYASPIFGFLNDTFFFETPSKTFCFEDENSLLKEVKKYIYKMKGIEEEVEA